MQSTVITATAKTSQQHEECSSNYNLCNLNARSTIESHKKGRTVEQNSKCQLQFAQAENEWNEDSNCNSNRHEHTTRVFSGVWVRDAWFDHSPMSLRFSRHFVFFLVHLICILGLIIGYLQWRQSRNICNTAVSAVCHVFIIQNKNTKHHCDNMCR